MHLFPIDLLTALPTVVAEGTALDRGMLKNYPDGSRAAHIATVVMWLGGILVVITLVASIWWGGNEKTKARLKVGLAFLLGAWTVLPPLWFAAEYLCLYSPSGDAGSWEAFKYSQDMWAKLWAGIVALLGVRLLALKDADSDGEKKRKEELSQQLRNLDERLKKLEPSSP